MLGRHDVACESRVLSMCACVCVDYAVHEHEIVIDTVLWLATTSWCSRAMQFHFCFVFIWQPGRYVCPSTPHPLTSSNELRLSQFNRTFRDFCRFGNSLALSLSFAFRHFYSRQDALASIEHGATRCAPHQQATTKNTVVAGSRKFHPWIEMRECSAKETKVIAGYRYTRPKRTITN